MRGGMGKLERPGHIARGVDVRESGLQEFVDLDGASGGNAHLFQAVALQVGDTPDGHQHRVERNAHVAPLVFCDEHLLPVLDQELLGTVIDQYRNTFGRETALHHLGNVRVFANHDARRHLHLRHLRAEASEGLRQFRTDRPTAEHDQPARQFAQIPDVVRGQVADFVDARNRRNKRSRAGGNDDAARRQALRAAIAAGDVHFPRRNDLRAAFNDIDAEFAVARHRVVRFHRADDRLHSLHHGREVEFRCRQLDPELPRARHVREQFRRTDQRLRRYAAGIQAVTAHLVLLDQRHFGLDRRGDIRRHQPGATGTDNHQVAVETGWFLPRCEQFIHATYRHDFSRQQGENPQENKGAEQCRRNNPRQRIDLRQLRAGIHVNHRSGEHADLADPVERTRLHPRQAKQQVQQEKRKNGDQPQREKIERPFTPDALVNGIQALAEARLDPVAEQKARHQESQGRSRGGREGDDDRPPKQSEDGPASERQQGRTGQRQSGHQDIDAEIERDRKHRARLAEGLDGCLLRLERLQVEVLAEIEEKKQPGRQAQDENQKQFS